MAILGKGHSLNGVRGRVGKTFILKKYGKQTVLANFPDESKNDRKPTKAQKSQRTTFKRAVAYAKSVLADPKLVAKYKRKLKGHRNVFQAALAEYLQNLKSKV